MEKAKEEYFELLRLLNKSNKTKNEVTHLRFVTDNSDPNHLKLYASISNGQKILLCQKKKETNWWPSQFSGLNQLEKFICYQLNAMTELDSADLILGNLFKHID